MINIFILIDALGWKFIKERPFLDEIIITKEPAKSILGFSSGVIPSILTGKYPEEHRHWSLYYCSPKTSPFRWTKALLWLPDNILNSRITRKIIEEVSKRLMGYTGYFETYLIPTRQLYLFDICEKRHIYAPKGVEKEKNIFDILKENKTDYISLSYPLSDSKILTKAKNDLLKKSRAFYFLYLSEFDALLHSYCSSKTEDEIKIKKAIDNYELEIKEIYQIAKRKVEQVNLFILSDHGMANVVGSKNLKKDIEKLGFKIPQDYVSFYDSTMARFWFYNDTAKKEIIGLLKTMDYGHILSEAEIKTYKINFPNNMYGHLIFLMNTGIVINPSHMGKTTPQGMHGFDINDERMDAVIMGNQKIERIIGDVKDFYNLMLSRIKHPTKIKILYFLNSIARGGVEGHVLELIDKIDKTKFEPLLVCPQDLVHLIDDDLKRLKVKFYPICIRKWSDFEQISKFFKILKKEKPQIVHSHLFFASMFAAPLAKLAGVPKVIETAHLREAWRKGIKKAYFIDRFFYRFVDNIIAVSDAVKNYLVNDKKVQENKIKVIHNGVDLEKFKPLEDVKSFEQNKFTVGLIGRLEPQKGHKYFLEAISLLNTNSNDARFLIVGDGSLRKQLEENAKNLGIHNKVEFLGYRSDIVDVLNEIDLLVLPSLYEGLPLVLLEAGAMGKPAIATNVDGNPETIINKETGLIVASGDSNDLKEGLELFLKNRHLVNQFGQKACTYIRNKFDLYKQVEATMELYYG